MVTLLNPRHRQVAEGISVFTAVKNRTESLEEALKTWVTFPEIDEIILLDWGSDESLLPLVRKYQNGKIVLAEAGPREKWILSFACNLAARLTSRTKILKLDADVRLLDGFFDRHPLKQGEFYCGNWRTRRNDNEMHLNGVVYVNRDDFFRVNGYNEYIKFYGWDDSDLYLRLEATGLSRHDLDLDTLYHIPHASRTQFQSTPAHLAQIPEEERATLATYTNRALAARYGKWTPEHTMLDFRVEIHDEHVLHCRQQGEDRNPVTPEMILECETTALRERLATLGLNISGELLDRLDRDELLELYNLAFLRKKEARSDRLMKIIQKADQRNR